MVASGATECAHSTSIDSSSPQSPLLPAEADCSLTFRWKQSPLAPPAPHTPGSPYCWLKVSASAVMPGSS